MNRLEFINLLGSALSALPQDEIKKALDYYVESIDDRMEDGMTEEEAIDFLGSISELAEKILSEQEPPAGPEPSLTASEEAPKKRRMPGWAWVLLILGSPIWLSLGLAAAIVALALYISAWAVLLSLVITGCAMLLCGIAGVPLSFFGSVFPDTTATRIFSCGLSLLVAGAGCLLLPASLFLVKGFCKAHKMLFDRLTRRRTR